MSRRFFAILFVIGLVLATASRPWCSQVLAQELGDFEGATDVGGPARAGGVEFDSETASYRVTGGGANMWFDEDAFFFVWKKVEGDVSLAADVEWVGEGGDPHRKACLLVRQSLDADSAYADAALHGDGLTSLQYRESNGAETREIQSGVDGPRRVRIEKTGDVVTLSVADEGEELRPAGGSFLLSLTEPFYVGLGVCAHDDETVETAVFSNVEIATAPSGEPGSRVVSTLETVPIDSGDRRVVYHTSDHIEAPNWSPDGESLVFNSGGRLYQIPVEGGTPTAIETGALRRLNNDHGFSPDGRLIAVSDQTDGPSRIHVLPAGGGEPRLVTPEGPSYWHGWSPDGRTLAYCAERDGEYDVYTIDVDGGEETRLTDAPGLDDGPDYSPDGEFIYFNSDRTGVMQIWRMRADGSRQEQITTDDYNDWFPHPSPDGRWIVFLSFEPEVEGHPANQPVQLRIMPVGGGEIRVLAKLFGGQGTINVPSWSPDSERIAFVSYRLVRP